MHTEGFVSKQTETFHSLQPCGKITVYCDKNFFFLQFARRCGGTKCLGESGVGQETSKCCATQGSPRHGDNQNIRSSPQLHHSVSSDTIPDEPEVLWSHRHTVHQTYRRLNSCFTCNETRDVMPTNASVLARRGIHTAILSSAY